MNTAQNGKGDSPRPVDGERFRSGWDMIFGTNDAGGKHKSVDETAICEKREPSKSTNDGTGTRFDLDTRTGSKSLPRGG